MAKKNKPRKTGYYWVQWQLFAAEQSWRVGFYNESTDQWFLPGQERVFHDIDFIQIHERQIPKNWVFGHPKRTVLWLLLAILIWNLASLTHEAIEIIHKLSK